MVLFLCPILRFEELIDFVTSEVNTVPLSVTRIISGRSNIRSKGIPQFVNCVDRCF